MYALSVSTLHHYDSSHGISLPLTCLCMTVAHILRYDNPFLSLPFFSLSSLSITSPITHSPIFLVCLPSFLPFRLGSRVFSPSLLEGTQPPTSSLCTFGLLAYTGPCPYRWRVHSICSRYRTHVEEHCGKSRHCTRNCQIFYDALITRSIFFSWSDVNNLFIATDLYVMFILYSIFRLFPYSFRRHSSIKSICRNLLTSIITTSSSIKTTDIGRGGYS